jgi:alkanesulfonate monooxygenase
MDRSELHLIGTCPGIGSGRKSKDFLGAISSVAGWADRDGWEAVLIYSDNRQADPWLVAQVVAERTRQLRPLVAVQPLYAHPFTAAKSVLTITHMYGRQVCLNMVAGSFPRDLDTLRDTTPHDRRYDRVVEYANIIRDLFRNPGLLSFAGDFYQVKNLQLAPKVDSALWPVFTISGSSGAGLNAAHKIGARAIQYLRPASEYGHEPFDKGLGHGTRLGVVARESHEEAWAVALRRYPDNPEGAEIREIAASVSDSVWVKELSRDVPVRTGHPYWLGPYKNYYAACPFLVGSTREVVAELVKYIRLGITTFLLEQPEDEEDSARVTEIFKAARATASADGVAPDKS